MPTRIFYAQSGRLMIAGALLLALLLWIASGEFTVSQADSDTPLHDTTAQPIPQVRAIRPSVETYQPELRFQGITAPLRQLWVKSERDGVVRELPIKQGDWVDAGSLLAKLDTRQLTAQLAQVKALLHSRELDFKAAQSLQGRGLVAETRHAESASALAEALSQLRSIELALEASEIRAPFPGFINALTLELGQYLRDGQDVAQLLDFQPTLVRGALTEQQVNRLNNTATAQVRLLHDQEYSGQLHYLAFQANPATRMIDVEIALDRIPQRPVAGTTAEIRFQLPDEPAHRISPALFSLDAQGNLGLTVVNPDQSVGFHRVELLGMDTQGFWIKPLPADLLLITVGQGFVKQGEHVRVRREDEAPSAPGASQ